MNHTTVKRTLPPGLRDSLRAAAQEELLPTMATLPRKDRDELRSLARQMLNLLDRSEFWRPDLLTQRIYFSVESDEQSQAALAHLQKMGCQHYPWATENVAMIFVNRRGEFTFLFKGDDLERHCGELARSSDWRKVTYNEVVASATLEQLQGSTSSRSSSRSTT